MSTRPYVRRIDQPAPIQGGGSQLLSAASEQLPAPVATVGRPENLTVTGTGLRQSAVTPTSYANLSWTPGPGTPPRAVYELEQATDAAFTQNRSGGTTSRTSASMDGSAGRTYYYRVRAKLDGTPGAWSNIVSASLPADTTAPDPPSAVTVAFAADGTLEVRATPPASANFKHLRVEVRNLANTVELDRSIFGGGLWTWSPARNKLQTAASGGSGWSTGVAVRVYAVSWGNIDSSVVTASATSAAPSTPTGLNHFWSGDTGTAGADLTVTWAPVAGLSYYLAIDGQERPVPAGRYPYAFEQNAQEHAGAADPVLSLSLVAENQIGQRSPTAATATATNAAPPATSIAVFKAFSTARLTIGASAALDILDYRVRVYLGGVLQAGETFFTSETRPTYVAAAGDGSYTFDVAARDRFGQVGTPSAQTTAATLQDMETYVATLRSGLIYSDSSATADATLAGLKDGITSVDIVAYLAGASWKWTQADWQEEITHQTTELIAGADIQAYIGTSLDGVTWTWFAGGSSVGGVWKPVSQASEAAAQTAATTLTGNVVWRVDLPAPRRTRYIRLGHRRTGGPYALKEFFPSTLLRGTYVEAESITTVNIGANFILADSAAIGALDGYLITAATFRTNDTPTRIEINDTDFRVINAGVTRVRIDTDGLKTFDSGGAVQVEATTATDGALKAGAGNVTLDKNGLSIAAYVGAAWALSTLRSLIWKDGATNVASIGGAAFTVGANKVNAIRIDTYSTAYAGGQITLLAAEGSGGASLGPTISIVGGGGSSGSSASQRITIDARYGATNIVGGLTIQAATAPGGAGHLTAEGGLNVGGALAAGVGQIRASGSLNGMGGSNDRRVAMQYDNTNDRGQIFAVQDGVAWKTLHLQPVDGGLMLGNATGGVGFHGVTPGPRYNITGSRAGNAALASLLNALAAIGLITNGTSA